MRDFLGHFYLPYRDMKLIELSVYFAPRSLDHHQDQTMGTYCGVDTSPEYRESKL